MEHVANEKGKAKVNGQEVVSQSVLLCTGVCTECGKVYVLGGQTKTVMVSKDSRDYFLSNHNRFMKGYFGGKIDTKI